MSVKPFSDQEIKDLNKTLGSGVSEVRTPSGQSTKFHDPKTMLEVRDRMKRENAATGKQKSMSRRAIFTR